MVFKVDWVLVDELAVGPCPKNQESLDILYDLKIKVVLSLCSEKESRLPIDIEEQFKCYRYILPDHKSSRSPKLTQLKEALSLIKVNLKYGPIFIHCFAAVERSPLVCMAWLVKECNLSSEQALDYLMQINPGTCPLPEQISTLRQLEREKDNL